MPDDDLIRVGHMLESAESVLAFIAGRTRADLDDDRILLFALVYAIQVIGEAASKVSTATRDAHPEIPWPAIVGMRNRLVHAYFDIDPEVVWKTATEELPAVLPLLRALVENH